MSRPARATPTQPPPPEEEHRHSDPPLRVRWGALEVVARGATALYAALIFGSFVVGSKVLPPAYDAVRDLTSAVRASADTLRDLSSEVREARQGVARVEGAQRVVEQRLERIESDVAGLRADLRASCSPKR